MPFTFSHPAIVFPATLLPRKYYSLTGLIIGSMVPDFEYFIRMSVKGLYGHNLSGVFWFDLPLALLLSIAFHHLVRNPLIHNLPRALYLRFSSFLNFNWINHLKTNFVVVCISIIAGTFSHIFWDSFTHENGYFVSLIPTLANDVVLFGKSFPVYKILQHTNSWVGGVIIAIIVYRLPQHETTTSQNSSKIFWPATTILAILVIFIRLTTWYEHFHFSLLIIIAVSACLLALTIASLLYKLPAINKTTPFIKKQNF